MLVGVISLLISVMKWCWGEVNHDLLHLSEMARGTMSQNVSDGCSIGTVNGGDDRRGCVEGGGSDDEVAHRGTQVSYGCQRSRTMATDGPERERKQQRASVSGGQTSSEAVTYPRQKQGTEAHDCWALLPANWNRQRTKNIRAWKRLDCDVSEGAWTRHRGMTRREMADNRSLSLTEAVMWKCRVFRAAQRY